MYRPKEFIETHPETIRKLMDQHPFATIITTAPDGPSINHLPVILETDKNGQTTLLGHMARANPQWKLFETSPHAVVIFHGPHAYISPDWYHDSFIPTWSYAVVHVQGKVKLLHDPQILDNLLEKTIDRFEPGPPKPWRQKLAELDRSSRLKAIVGFQIEIETIEAKFKISQNRSSNDIRGVLQGLEAQSDDMSKEMRELMLNHYTMNES